MRHAEAATVAPSDHERPLTPRGTAAASEAGRWLAGQGGVPDHALVSAARRTQDTWEAVAVAAGWDLEPVIEPALYAAGPDSALDLVRLVPAAASCVLLLGHNPTVSYLAQVLSDGQGSPEHQDQMIRGFPPGAAAVFEVTGPWSDLAFGRARLAGFHVGSA